MKKSNTTGKSRGNALSRRDLSRPDLSRRDLSRREFTRTMALAGAGLPLVGSILQGQSPLASPRQGTAAQPEPWKIHIFSKHLQFLDYQEMAAASRASGVDGVDLSVRPGGHVLPENVERDLPLAVSAVRKAGLEMTMMTTGITDPGDPASERILEVASDLGIGYYRLGYYHYDPDLEMTENLARIKEKMNKLAELNEKYRIHGAYQNHAGNYFGAPVWDLWEVVRDLDPRWIGCQYDIRHATVEGAQSWPMGLRLLKEHIRCMVIKDFEWVEEDGSWRIKDVPVGEGMVDFRAYYERLKELGISGPISLHIEYPLFPDEVTDVAEMKALSIRTIQQDVKAIRKMLPDPDQ